AAHTQPSALPPATHGTVRQRPGRPSEFAAEAANRQVPHEQTSRAPQPAKHAVAMLPTGTQKPAEPLGRTARPERQKDTGWTVSGKNPGAGVEPEGEEIPCCEQQPRRNGSTPERRRTGDRQPETGNRKREMPDRRSG